MTVTVCCHGSRSALKELNGNPPRLFDEGDGIDFEAVAETQPDVILAAYSGLNRNDYATLSQIAPVVAIPGHVVYRLARDHPFR